MLRSLRALIPYLLRYRWRYVAGLVALVLKSLFAAAVPVFIKQAVDATAAGDTGRTLWMIAGGLLAVAALKSFFQFWMRWIINGNSRRIEYDIANDLLGHLLYLPQRFYRSYTTGDIMSRAVNDLSAVRMMIGAGIMVVADITITFAVVLTVMATTDWRLTCVVFLPIPLVSITVAYFGRQVHARFLAVQESLADIASMTQENLTNVRVIRAYGQTAAEGERFQRLNEAYRDQNMKLVAIWRRFYPQLELLVSLTFLLVLGYGGWRTSQGAMTIGSFAMFLSYMAMLTWPMIGLGWGVNLWQRGSAALSRIHELMDYPVSAPNVPAVDHSITSLRGAISTENVSVTYPNSSGPALDGLSLSVDSGQTLAIVGAVGAGKTTLLNLIPRVNDASSGIVRVDGIDARTIPLNVLRSSIGYVPQESFLFHRSVRENLKLGSRTAEDWQLQEAATVAQVWDEIQSFPNGLDTLVGERGITLSGGQQQRVCLARALLRDPRILLLDDALSSVDAGTEEAIIEKLRLFMRNRTTLVSSHRLSAVRHADQIAVLREGKLVEYGSHEDLIDADDIYADLYRKQLIEQELVRDE
jgi:ATP-binding cassette subfamily B multidrug efflux pump